MPELPEVETVLRGINPHILNHSVESITLRRPNLRYPFPDAMGATLKGTRIVTSQRRGKYIALTFDSGKIMVIHLGMSGQVKIIHAADSAGYEYAKHDHFDMALNSGDRMIFNDPRRFGFILLFDDMADIPFLNAMGPEPLGNHFSGTYLYDTLRKRKKPIKSALLDQAIVAGLGNIYVCEALYDSYIHPEALCNALTRAQCDDLVRNIIIVLKRAIESGGSSLKDYRKSDGSMGYFQHHFNVYGREGEICGRCAPNEAASDDTIDALPPCIKRITQSGRSTFYCTNTQKKR